MGFGLLRYASFDCYTQGSSEALAESCRKDPRGFRSRKMRTGQRRRWAMYPYTDRELETVALRTQGLAPRDIARRLLTTPGAVSNRLLRVRQKAGLASMADFNDWAIRSGLDEWIAPEAPAPRVHRKRGRKRIRMGRI